MDNASLILQTLDGHLGHPVRLVFDLILTKMMRGDDPQDMADIAFMVRHDRITAAQVESVFVDAVIPEG